MCRTFQCVRVSLIYRVLDFAAASTQRGQNEKGLGSWNISEALEAGFCQHPEEELCLGGSGPAPPTLHRAVDSCAQGSFSSMEGHMRAMEGGKGGRMGKMGDEGGGEGR